MGYQDKFVGTTSDSTLNTEKFGFYGTVSRELAYILEQVNDVIRAVHEGCNFMVVLRKEISKDDF